MESLPPHELRRLTEAADRSGRPLDELISARLGGEPLQYLEGTAAFGPLNLLVDRRVLIPRPETEQLWELARTLVDDPAVIVDVGTGSGALALALKRSFPSARVLATDISGEAATVASDNAIRTGLDIEVLTGDLFDPLPEELAGSIDLIVSNPPYVAEDEWDRLPEDVRREPRVALVAGDGGMAVLRRLAEGSVDWLAPGGHIVCEIGETQAAEARAWFGRHLDTVEIRRDLSGQDRFVIGRS